MGERGIKDIGGLGGHFTQAVSFNNHGEIAGTSLLAGDQLTRSFIYRDGSLKDMGDLGGQNVYVHNMNEYGVATGYSDIPAGTPEFGHAFLWKDGHMIDLGGGKSGYNCTFGESVNVHEQVVGSAGCNADGLVYLFLWEDGGPIVDLRTLIVPAPTLNIYQIISINDRGEIACQGTLPTGENRACLLVPVDDDHEWCDKDDEVAASVENSPAAKAQSGPSLSAAAAGQIVRDQMMKSVLRGSSRYHLPNLRNDPVK